MESTLDVMKKMRYVDRNLYDRIEKMALKRNIKFDATVDVMARRCIQTNNPEKYKEVLKKLEQTIIHNESYNFIIENIPRYAVEKDSNEKVKVGYVHVKDTLLQFGDLDTFDLVNGTVYAKFTDKTTCHSTHALINNMMIGDNIIQTRVV